MLAKRKDTPPAQEEQQLGRASSLLQVLADRNRLRILWLLRGGEMCVCKVTAALEISQALVSHHLAVLRTAGLVCERRDGRWVHYSLEPSALQEAAAFLHGLADAARSAPRPERPALCDTSRARRGGWRPANGPHYTRITGERP